MCFLNVASDHSGLQARQKQARFLCTGRFCGHRRCCCSLAERQSWNYKNLRKVKNLLKKQVLLMAATSSQPFRVICLIGSPLQEGSSVGSLQFTNKSYCFATWKLFVSKPEEILDAMNRDCGIPLSHLQVDGEMTSNSSYATTSRHSAYSSNKSLHA